MIGRVDASAMITTTNIGLGVVDRVVQILRRRRPASRQHDGEHEWHAPEREHDFDLAEEMQDSAAMFGRGARPAALCCSSLPVLNAMSGLDETRRKERMNNRQEEDCRRNRVEGVRLYP